MEEPKPPRRLRSVPTGARPMRSAPDAPARPAAPRLNAASVEGTARTAPAVTIRAARADEAGAVAEVYLASRRRAGALIPRGVHTDDDVRTWFANVVLREHETVVAEGDGRLVAMLVLRGESLDQLYVHPDRQRQGIGGRLLAHAKARRRRLRLQTFESNEPARAFYEKHGFRAVAFGDGTANDEGAPDILYEWTAR